MPFSQKCFIRSSCARTTISDPDLEGKTRFSPRSILDDSFLGEGVALWRGVVGPCPGCPEEGGKGWRGLHPVPSHLPFLEKGVWDPCIYWTLLGPWFLLDDSSGPWTPLSFFIFYRCRCDRQGPITNSSSEDETPILHFCKQKIDRSPIRTFC